jgi:hypothetical protein
MVQFLFELLFWSVPEVLLHVAVRGWQGNATHAQPWPYDWKNRFDDPVYKKNLQRLIERNRQFEEARNEPRS